MKKPFLKWFVTNATNIVPITPAAPSGVSNPRTSMTPAPISVSDASHACTMPGFMPRLANQPPVPCDLAAAEDVADAVGEHHRADPATQDQQPEIDRV